MPSRVGVVQGGKVVKVFVSGKVGDEADARRVMDILRALGHDLTFDWTAIPHLQPYDDNADAAARAAVLEVRGVQEADALVLVAHERGVGMYVELGIALGLGKKVYVITAQPSRTMFFHHPLVTVLADPDDLALTLAV
jgi:nucleoside 2-deoxyribosyltransferase